MEAPLEVVAEHVATYYGDSVCVTEATGKGRVLLAVRDFDPGDRILLEFPLVEATADPAAPAYSALVRLRERGLLESAPIFYWAVLCSLTASDVIGVRGDAGGWPTVAMQTQEHAFQLCAPSEALLEPSPSIRAVVEELWDADASNQELLLRLEHLLQVWTYNSFDLGGDADEGAEPAAVIYLAASMLSHACSPNAAWHLDEENSFILHARSGIAEGEEITIPYLSPIDLRLPTCARREILSATKAFDCGCERCAASVDTARAFICPRCTGTAYASTETPVFEETVERRDDSIRCAACGPLFGDEAAPLLATESALQPWAKAQLEAQCKGELGQISTGCGNAREELRQAEERGLANTHWIIDVLRSAATTECPAMACDLLRQRILAQEASGPHLVTGCTRLRLMLGALLVERGDSASLKEAVEMYEAAAEVFALLFGDDHGEHQEAIALRSKAAQKLASVSSRAPATTKASGLEAEGESDCRKGGKRAAGRKKMR